ncbi:sulfotransferase domain protein [bacterium BMS3Bbin07]|nr:sulfotransferase domain protein [bacterium BMS3Bbin07]HDH01596.1 sulfotransferase family protein [Nitrospirota bacterium]
MRMSESLIIVTGLPRSGTSMMMKMLQTGGMEVLMDNIRKADEDNPEGYYEFERVKKIKEDTSWLDGVEGKVVKMASMLLYDLPSDKKYRLIFMKRNLEEILLSQRKMLQRKGAEDNIDDEEMRRLFSKHLEEIEAWLSGQQNVEVLYVDYNDMLRKPQENIRILNGFLDNIPDTDRMIKVVDNSLYRNRKSSGIKADEREPEDETESVKDDEKIKARLSELGYM